MIRTEIAELMDKDGVLYDVAEKVEYHRDLTAEEKEIAEISDAWAREIGKKGNDPDHQIAEFINKTVTEEVYNAPDELLDRIFDRGTIGEFDDYEGTTDPKNTLVAYESAKGGNVDRSYIDSKNFTPKWKNRQIETDLSYVDLRKNGFKSIATLTTFMAEACKNAMFYDVFAECEAASGIKTIAVSGANPTVESMDELSLYLNDLGSNSTIVTLNKYAQKIRRMEGYSQYLSDQMKNDFNRYGLATNYDGINIAGISGAKKLANGNLLIPD